VPWTTSTPPSPVGAYMATGSPTARIADRDENGTVQRPDSVAAQHPVGRRIARLVE
jgi:hypothetical protein